MAVARRLCDQRLHRDRRTAGDELGGVNAPAFNTGSLKVSG